MNLSKIVIHFFVLFLPFTLMKGNEIDSLKTNEDVNQFMEKHFGYKYSQFTVADTNHIWSYHSQNNSYKLIADTLGMKFWYKTDFNNDDKTDLLFYGSYINGKHEYSYKVNNILCVIDSDSGSYQLIPLYSKLGKGFPIILKKGFESLILLYQTVEDNFQYRDDPRYTYLGVDDEEILLAVINNKPYVCVDTLVYKFGTFIEYNSNPTPKEIDKIYFENDCGMLACYVMRLTIKSNRRGILIGGEYYEDKIKYNTWIDTLHFNEIINLISYMNFDWIASGYSSGITDASSVEIKIWYDDMLKEVYDYGRSGTLGLRRLYDLLYGLRFNQKWKKALN